MTHTLETLLPLLDKDGNPINQEASDKLRVWAAELDGGKPCDPALYGATELWHFMGQGYCMANDLPNYPTSLDAIFAAEKRAGLHDKISAWRDVALRLSFACELTFTPLGNAQLTPAQRTVILILTLQQKQTL